MLDKKTVSQCISADYCRGWNDAVDAIPRWISVEERLPESYVSVIGYLPIQNNEGFPPTREVFRTDRGWFAPALSEMCIVTHWMPMPKGLREV